MLISIRKWKKTLSKVQVVKIKRSRCPQDQVYLYLASTTLVSYSVKLLDQEMSKNLERNSIKKQKKLIKILLYQI